MHNFYEEDMKLFRLVFPKSIFGNILYSRLFPLTEDKELTLDKLFQKLRITLISLHIIPETFIEYFFKAFSYEIAFDIYNTAKASKRLTSNASMRSYIHDYIDCISLCPNDVENIESYLKEPKKQLKADAILMSLKTTKLRTFHQYIAEPLLNTDDLSLPASTSEFFKRTTKSVGNIAIPIAGKDFVFYINTFKNSIYNTKNQKKEFKILNFFKLIEDYYILHDCSKCTDFDTEYSAYIFEKLYYPIQFCNYICNFIDAYPHIKKTKTMKPSDAYMPLFIYTRLFDTHYLSLTKFILQEDPACLTSLYKNPAIAFEESSNQLFHYYSDYIFPLITLMTKSVLFEYCENNLQKICEMAAAYIYPQIQEPYSYSRQLNEAFSKIKIYKYPDNNSDLYRASADQKLNMNEQLFNTTLSKCFFLKEIKPFINVCGNPTKKGTPESYLAFINEQYNQINDIYGIFSWEKANEHMHTQALSDLVTF